MDVTTIPEWARLAFIAAGIPLLLATVLALISFKISIEHVRQKNPELAIYSDLQLPRGFSNEDYRLKKRSIFLDYHPDRIKEVGNKEEQMKIFTNKQNQLDMLLEAQKREMLDRYNFTLVNKQLDSDRGQEMILNLTYSYLMNVIPSNVHWLGIISGAMLLGDGHGSKPLMNSLIVKVLFDIYHIIGKPITGKDLLDYVLPYTTIYERRFLTEHVFAVILALMILELVVRHPKEKPVHANINGLEAHVAKIGGSTEKLAELKTIATKLNVIEKSPSN